MLVLTFTLFLTGCDTLSLMAQSGKFFCNRKYLSESAYTPKTPNDFEAKKILIINLQMMDTFMF